MEHHDQDPMSSAMPYAKYLMSLDDWETLSYIFHCSVCEKTLDKVYEIRQSVHGLSDGPMDSVLVTAT